MKNFELVIAGGGLTAARAIKSYRESGGGGQIALLSNDGHRRRCRRAHGTTDAGSFHFDKLLIATGATPRRLTVPGPNLDEVYALRTLRDSEACRGSGYDTVSSFFSEVFGTTVKVFGDVSRFDALTMEGSLASGTLLISYSESGRLVGAPTVGASDELETLLNDLIVEHAPMDALESEPVGGRSR